MAAGVTDMAIAQLYDAGDVTIEDLKQMFPDLEVDAIKLSLVQNSILYRQRLKDKGEVFSESAHDRAQQVIEQMMESADCDAVRFRCAKLVLDEKKGLRDVKNLKTINVNIQVINQQMKAAEEAERKAKMKVIDVDERHQHLKEIAA